MWIFFGVIFIGTYFTYKAPVDLLALIANIFYNVAAFQDNDKGLRWITMCGTVFFITYNYLIFSPAMIMLESIFLSSNIVGYCRFYLKPNLINKK